MELLGHLTTGEMVLVVKRRCEKPGAKSGRATATSGWD
jgi:hypothetical protein